MIRPDNPLRSAPAALRNRDPILDVLRQIAPASGMVLEVASGTGEHVVHFARHLPHLSWQPSDPSFEARQSIAAWTAAAEGLTNVLPPVEFDVAQTEWPVAAIDAILCINMVHISPWQATQDLMRWAGMALPKDGLLYLYGPYRSADRSLEPSNEAFDRDLQARDPRWGLREISAVIACAEEQALVFDHVIEMPANNLSVIFRKT